MKTELTNAAVVAAKRAFEAEAARTKLLLEAGKILRWRGSVVVAGAVEREAAVMGERSCEAWNAVVERARVVGLIGLVAGLGRGRA